MLLPLLCIVLTGCHRKTPSISFTQVPKGSPGGSNTDGILSGRVAGFAPGDEIVLFSYAVNRWWVQPYADAPYTAIKPDGTWSAQIHLGTEYAALLVHGRSYKPQAVLFPLPPVGSGIVSAAIVHASPAPPQISNPPKTLRFSGYDWEVRSTSGGYGGRDHAYDNDNVWVDDAGAMHLRVSRRQEQWVCAEAHTLRTLGYGTYQFTMRDAGHLEPAAMLSMFTWTDAGPGLNHREMDIHVSRWGAVESKSAEYVIQPYYLPANVYRYNMPPGSVTATLAWTPGHAEFTTSTGSGDTKPIAAWTFTAGIPASSDEKTYLNLCEFQYSRLPMQKETEVVIDRFQFLP